MEKFYSTQRPSLLLAAACAPSVSGLPSTASAVLTAPRPTPAPRAHQAQIQAELAQALVIASGSNGINGFTGRTGSDVRMDGASGVPPRGRPV